MPPAPNSTSAASSKSSNNTGDLYLIGWVKQAHGIRGELFVALKAKQADWLSSCNRFILVDKEQPSETLPLSILKAKAHKDGLIVKLDSIEDRNQAEGLKGREVWISQSCLVSKDPKQPYLLELLNFQAKDPLGGFWGQIVGFGSNGAQDLLVIKNETGEFEVPFVEAFLQEIDFEDRVIVLDLPEGLVDR